MPAGLEVTKPVPAPAVVTLRTYVGTTALKLAVTLFAASIVTVQAPVPVHAPLQPVKVLAPFGVAFSVTAAPFA